MKLALPSHSRNQTMTQSKKEIIQLANFGASNINSNSFALSQGQFFKTNTNGFQNQSANNFNTQRQSKKFGMLDTNEQSMSVAYRDSSKYSSRFVEQWLNDTLEECYHLGIPGVISRPEHKLPLSRHGLDRITLTNIGIPNDMVSRVYRSLFVFTLGFFELLNDSTKNLNENRVTIQSQIWKVFQILLEYCCKTDYSLITQQMEKQHKEEVEEMDSKYRDTILKLELSEQSLKQELRTLQTRVDELEFERNNQDQERQRMLLESQKNQQKHEEEVQLRLFFESKLNTMHHVNREITNKFKQMKMKYAEESIRNKDLDKRIQNLLDENSKHKTQTETSQQEILNLQTIKEQIQNNYDDQQLKLTSADVELVETKRKLAFFKEQYDELIKQKNTVDMTLITLQDYQDTKNNEHSNVQNYLDEMTLRKSEMESTVDQMRLREERTRSKLKFYKSQYTGFEVTKKAFLEEQKLLRQEIRDLQQKLKQAQEDEFANQVRKAAVDDRLFQVKLENEEIQEKFGIVTQVRHDLEQQLKQQIDQTKKMYYEREAETKQLLQLKRDLMAREFKFKEVQDERNDLELQVATLENDYDQLKMKYENNNMNLRSLVENEKDSRDTMKERYEKEFLNTTFLNKQITQFKSENLEFRNKISKYELLISQMKEEKEAMKQAKTENAQKLIEANQQIERAERELFIKRNILDEYDVKKKSEISSIKQQTQQQLKQIRYLEMLVEDLSSDLMRSYHFKQQLHEQEDIFKDKVKEFEQKILQQKSNYNDLFKEKLLVQRELDEKLSHIDDLNVKSTEQYQKIQYQQLNIESLQLQLSQLHDLQTSLEAQLEEKLQQLSDISIEKDTFLRQTENLEKSDKQVQACVDISEFCQQCDLGSQRQSIFQNNKKNSQNLNELQNSQNHVKGTLLGSTSTKIQDYENSYSGNPNQSKKLKPMFQQKNSINRPQTTSQNEVQTQEEVEAYTNHDQRKTSQNKDKINSTSHHNRNNSSNSGSEVRIKQKTNIDIRITNPVNEKQGKNRNHTSYGQSRNQGKNNFGKEGAKTLRQNLNEKDTDPYNDASTNTVLRNDNAGSTTVGFDQSARIGTTQSKPSSQTFSDSFSMHKKKLSGGDSSQPRIKRLLKNAYSQRD
eukprot:403332609